MDLVAQCALGAGVTALFHPITYAKILIQIGYEPLPAIQSKTLLGRDVLMYPNVFKYIGHIKKTDGFFGLYRGLSAKLTSGIICSYVSNTVQASLSGEPLGAVPRQHCEEREGQREGQAETQDDTYAVVRRVVTSSSIETISRSAGIIISHPFHVIFVRSVAQFIGRETRYTSLWSSINEIWEKDGLLGFFRGLIPRLIGEILTIWLTNVTAQILYTIMANTQSDEVVKSMRNYTVTASQLAVTQFTYPFNLVSNVMCVNNSGLAAGSLPYSPVYFGWTDCWKRLSDARQMKRGSGLFFRVYAGPVVHGRDGLLYPAVSRDF